MESSWFVGLKVEWRQEMSLLSSGKDEEEGEEREGEGKGQGKGLNTVRASTLAPRPAGAAGPVSATFSKELQGHQGTKQHPLPP